MIVALISGACTASPSEDDVNAISTSAAATVEARFTAVAATLSVMQQPTTSILATDTPWPTPQEVLVTFVVGCGVDAGHPIGRLVLPFRADLEIVFVNEHIALPRLTHVDSDVIDTPAFVR